MGNPGAPLRSRGAAGGKTALLGWLELLKHTETRLLFVPLMPGHRLQQRQREDEGAQVGLLSPLLLLLLVSSWFSSPWGWPRTFCALPFPKSENLSFSGPEELGSLGYLGQERGLARVISQQDLAPALQLRARGSGCHIVHVDAFLHLLPCSYPSCLCWSQTRLCLSSTPQRQGGGGERREMS